MENRAITKMPYKDKNSLVVIECFMSRSALAASIRNKEKEYSLNKGKKAKLIIKMKSKLI